MTRVLVVCPNPLDGTSFYRSIGPLTSLARQGKVEIIQRVNPDWTDLKYCDIVLMQRPAGMDAVNIMERAMKLKKRIWVEYDDLLTHVPDSNVNHHLFWHKEIQQSIVAMLTDAEIVSLSTPYMAEVWKSYIKGQCVVIPNAWDDLMYPNIKSPVPSERKALLWRGTCTHDEDLLEVTPALESISKNEPKVDWYFLGTPLWFTLRNVARHSVPNIRPFSDLVDYFYALENTNPTAMLVPLADSPFNRAKSNIAWIEATWAGGVAVAPDWDEWRKPGVVTYMNDFEDKVRSVIHNDINAVEQHGLSKAYIESELRLSKVNYLRLKLLK